MGPTFNPSYLRRLRESNHFKMSLQSHDEKVDKFFNENENH